MSTSLQIGPGGIGDRQVMETNTILKCEKRVFAFSDYICKPFLILVHMFFCDGLLDAMLRWFNTIKIGYEIYNLIQEAIGWVFAGQFESVKSSTRRVIVASHYFTQRSALNVGSGKEALQWILFLFIFYILKVQYRENMGKEGVKGYRHHQNWPQRFVQSPTPHSPQQPKDQNLFLTRGKFSTKKPPKSSTPLKL